MAKPRTERSLLFPSKEFREEVRKASKDRGFRSEQAFILAACERAILAAGFSRVELVATLPGEPLYTASGYKAIDQFDIPMKNGLTLPAVKMTKVLPPSLAR